FARRLSRVLARGDRPERRTLSTAAVWHARRSLAARRARAVVPPRDHRSGYPWDQPGFHEIWPVASRDDRRRRGDEGRGDAKRLRRSERDPRDDAAEQPLSKRQAREILGSGRGPADGDARRRRAPDARAPQRG